MDNIKPQEKISFGIVGSGWRSEFFLRIAKALPNRFQVTGLVTRSEVKGKEIENLWGVKTFRTIDELIKGSGFAFVVVCVPWDIAPIMIKELSEKKVPVLSETPPAPNLEALIEINKLTQQGAKIQVAEQYHLQPLHAARIAIANSGKLGEISQVQLSVCHGYHGISLIRRLLGIKFENATISASEIISPLVMSPGREGDPTEEKSVESHQVIASLDFGKKLGIYDFTDDQYFSYIRAQRLLIRGYKGEITDKSVRYLKDFRTPVEFELKRQNAGEDGNLAGYYLKGILAGEEWIYENPLIPGRLTDDEIAIGSCLLKMYQYTKDGIDFYSLAEASQDHYLSLMINQAVSIGEKVKTESQPWSLK
ncbi:MAG TPA: Gfo/Idh/MocA family oxidoreductase [Clostridiaceae bacterium]